MSSRDGAGIGRVDVGREFVEELIVGAEQVGGPSEDRCDVARGDRGRERQEFVADPAPPQDGVVVRRVPDGFDLQLAAHVLGVGPSQRQERMLRPWLDRGEPGRSAPSQEPEEQGLGLVVEGVSSHGGRREQGASHGPRPGFEVRSGSDVGVVDDELDADDASDVSGAPGVRARLGTHAVVDVVGGDHEAVAVGERDQRRRIGPSRERADDVLSGVGKGAVGEEAVERVQSSCSRPR